MASGRDKWIVLFGVWQIYICFGLTIASLAPLIAPIREELGIGNSEMGAILGAWPLVYIFAAIPCGAIVDYVGSRRALLLAALIIAFSGLARSVSDTPTQLWFAVALFGLGGPLISAGAPKLIASLFEGKSRATAMGIYITGPYLGGILSLSLTNSLIMPNVDGSWRTVVLIYASLAGLSGLIWYLITWASAQGQISNEFEKGARFELAVLRSVLQSIEVRLILVMAVGLFFIIHSINNWMPEILRSHGLSGTEAGLRAALVPMAAIVGALIFPRLAVPKRRQAVMACLLVLALSASVTFRFSVAPLLIVGLILHGLASGAMLTVSILMLTEAIDIPSDRLGIASGFFFSIAQIGGVVGPLTFGVLSDLSNGFELPLVVVSGVCLLLLGTLYALQQVWKRPLS